MLIDGQKLYTVPLTSNICPTVAASPDTKKDRTNWIKAMRTSGFPCRH